MKRRKLLKTLADFLDQEGRKQRRHSAELSALLEKLKQKELEIVRAQHEKGVKTLQSLET